jgi:predicted nucleotidyltransferase component of viral defense system
MKDLIQKKLAKYNPTCAEDELMALKEITQEVVLYSLQKVGFFRDVCFLGGTSLRIIHGVNRFSEDLDFSTNNINRTFDLEYYLGRAMNEMNAYGYDLNINKKDIDDRAVKSRFLKDDSIKKVITFKYKQDPRKLIKIKVEIDTDPPEGANRVVEFIEFPEDFSIASYDLPTLMSGKIHALLCRPYPKGRDWFDFFWYISNKISPNLVFLENALYQQGPWKEAKISVDTSFIKQELLTKVETLNFVDIKDDVQKFLMKDQSKSLDVWGLELFKNKINKLL